MKYKIESYGHGFSIVPGLSAQDTDGDTAILKVHGVGEGAMFDVDVAVAGGFNGFWSGPMTARQILEELKTFQVPSEMVSSVSTLLTQMGA